MTSSKERNKEQVKRRTEQTWLKRNSKCHDLVKVLFFLRIWLSSLARRNICVLSTRSLSAREEKTYPSGNCLRPEVSPLD